MTGELLSGDIEEIVRRLGPAADAFAGKHVLLTGGCGFLGRYFTAMFGALNNGRLSPPCRVTVLDNLISVPDAAGMPAGGDGIMYVRHDVIQPVDAAAIPGAVDYVIHAAGIASPYYYRKYPLETLEVATLGTKHMLRLAVEHRVKGFLYFSSSEIYGDPDPAHVPTPESYRGHVSCVGPRACYDEAKRLGETLCMIYHQQEGVPTKTVRPFNVYGPGMSPRDYRVLPSFASKIFAGQPVSVYSSGRQTRTFCYVVDALVGFTMALLEGVPGDVYNIGNPRPEISMLELVREFEQVLARPVAYRNIDYPDSYPADEPQRRCPDITKASVHLGFHSEVLLGEGLSRFVRWAERAYPRE